MSEEFSAVRRFRAFHHRAPSPSELVRVSASPVVSLEVGRLVGLAYLPLNNVDGKPSYHDFEKPLPRVFVSFDGKQIFIFGGSYDFTARGFEH